jgi:RNA polymerase sigma-70 factor (ECF subfamily)
VDTAQEKQLIERIAAGNPGAFRKLIETYKRLVSQIIYRNINNEADREDLCQEVFLKVFENLSGFQYQSKLSTWIAKITYNTCINYLEKKKVPLFDDFRPDDITLDDFAAPVPSPDRDAETDDTMGRLMALVHKLPARYRTILTLYHLQEMSYAEIGEVLELPDGTVKNYLFRARKILREVLASEYEKEELWR